MCKFKYEANNGGWRAAALCLSKRYSAFSGAISRLSITRLLQNELIASLPAMGKVLDFGGGSLASYRSLLKCESYQSANIDPAIEPTWLLEVGADLECNSNSFDVVICFNTLEHVYDAKHVIGELARVLRIGGSIYLTTPFLYPIHGHPDDFFRPTPSWYLATLDALGFEDIDVHSLFWGPCTTGQVCTGIPGPFKLLRKKLALFLDYCLGLIRLRKNWREEEAAMYSQRLATGFFVSARKVR